MRISLLITFLFGFMLNATVILPDVLGHNMVLQQNSSVILWGSANANTKITLKVSWSAPEYNCVSAKNGNWQISIPTCSASFTKQSITVSDGKSITLNNILIGEVWLCSGQSNMEMPLGGYKNEFVEEAADYMAVASDESGIRMFNVVKSASVKGDNSGKGSWLESNKQNFSSLSATAYFFALRLSKNLQVPIGIINASYGGSSIEGWLHPGAVEKYNDFEFKQGFPDSMRWMRPYVMYQNMIKPLSNYIINGFVWYQGESNVGRFASYAQKLQDLVYLWRFTFHNPDLPFYVVEIAPYQYDKTSQAAKLREAQLKGINLIANSGFVCTNDLVYDKEITIIHPSQKKPIGDRVANLVLHNNYGYDSIKANSPSLSKFSISSDSIILTFDNNYDGFLAQQELVGFEIADSSQVFRKAEAFFGEANNTISIKFEKGFRPLAVRYCFNNFQVGNVKNSAGLPLIPFRTDEWDN